MIKIGAPKKMSSYVFVTDEESIKIIHESGICPEYKIQDGVYFKISLELMQIIEEGGLKIG